MSKSKGSGKKGLLPKLRFPEFRDAGDWASKCMGILYSFQPTNSYSREKLNYIEGEVKNIHYGDIHTKFATLFDVTREKVPFINLSESLEKVNPESYCLKGDMVFADASEDLDDIGKSIEIVNTNNEKILSGLHTLMARQRDSELVIGFGGHLFKSSSIRKQIKKESQGTKVLGISSGRLSKIKVCLPLNKDEQQKITDCLSSLDALIAAQADKLDALKVHKKGLMQRLFPREGETVPELRFPEFRDGGEWEEKTLGSIAEFLKGKGISKADIHSDGNQPCIRYGELYTLYRERIDTVVSNTNLSPDELFLSHAGDVIIPASGETKIDIATAACVIHRNVALGSDLNIIRSKQDGVFLSYYLNGTLRLEIAKVAQGDTVVHLYKSNLEKLKVAIPLPEEQRRVADCLSSLDALIDAQAEKLDALKIHKRGLMQQIFPSPEVTDA
ncbi:MAG: restriction endonuclease subunit S [Candidatus Hydrogenedentes bacterium]|nr:restriction endonuclease subunit S [Candidatus Hydrogenedentota bacterium]